MTRGRSDETSDCPAARDYSRAYLHHLVKSDEILAAILLTWNNLHFYQELMRSLRAGDRDRPAPGFPGPLRQQPGRRRHRPVAGLSRAAS